MLFAEDKKVTFKKPVKKAFATRATIKSVTEGQATEEQITEVHKFNETQKLLQKHVSTALTEGRLQRLTFDVAR